MGMSAGTGGKSGGRRRRGVPRYGAMAEINMTPFIDVMLVLLIIFMVAAPLLATGVPIDLPETRASALNIEQKPISIAITEKGEIYFADQPAQLDELADKVRAAVQGGADDRIYVRASRAVPYGRVAEVMAMITSAGFKKVALVTEQEKK